MAGHPYSYPPKVLMNKSALTGYSPRLDALGIEIVYYVLRADGLVKIGTTQDGISRLRRHRKDGAVSILAIEFGGRDLERERHQQFAHLREGRHEWFRYEDDLREHIDGLRVALRLDT